jgi:hypothetical protein
MAGCNFGPRLLRNRGIDKIRPVKQQSLMPDPRGASLKGNDGVTSFKQMLCDCFADTGARASNNRHFVRHGHFFPCL